MGFNNTGDLVVMYLLLLLAWGDDCFKTLLRVIHSLWKLLYRKTKEVKPWFFLLILYESVSESRFTGL